jgi:nitrate/TMAO reductase-like tetraheme cytochrome c subunit
MNNGEKKNAEKEKNTAITDDRKVNYKKFAGAATCITCHKNIYESFIHTSHFLTSQPASEKYIKGSFEKGKNIFPFNDHLFVSMEKRDSGFYQVAWLHGIEKVAKRFDIVTGSGAKGQTYLSWRNNELFQLPISFLTAANEWANSPGYDPGKVIYNRPVTSRCLECHSTYFNVISPSGKEPEEYDHDQILYGVECEKCHGPGAKHVEYQTQNSKDQVGRYIINPSKFSRQQSLDLCGLCHGGRLQKTKPSFEFVAGDTLSNYFVPGTAGPATKEIDVHGNQLGLLKESKCFRVSATMTCITCHNTHENERGETELFSQRCMTCHNKEHGTFCKIDPSTVSSITSNCIDCHMPKQPSMSVALLLRGDIEPTAALIHTHLIKIYPEEAKRFITNKNRMHQKH